MARTKTHAKKQIQREQVPCSMCGCNITIHNSSTASHCKRKVTPRCGPCYLKWRAEERKRKGQL